MDALFSPLPVFLAAVVGLPCGRDVASCYSPAIDAQAQYPEEYKYSSAKFYEKGIDNFVFLSHYGLAAESPLI